MKYHYYVAIFLIAYGLLFPFVDSRILEIPVPAFIATYLLGFYSRRLLPLLIFTTLISWVILISAPFYLFLMDPPYTVFLQLQTLFAVASIARLIDTRSKSALVCNLSVQVLFQILCLLAAFAILDCPYPQSEFMHNILMRTHLETSECIKAVSVAVLLFIFGNLVYQPTLGKQSSPFLLTASLAWLFVIILVSIFPIVTFCSFGTSPAISFEDQMIIVRHLYKLLVVITIPLPIVGGAICIVKLLNRNKDSGILKCNIA